MACKWYQWHPFAVGSLQWQEKQNPSIITSSCAFIIYLLFTYVYSWPKINCANWKLIKTDCHYACFIRCVGFIALITYSLTPAIPSQCWEQHLWVGTQVQWIFISNFIHSLRRNSAVSYFPGYFCVLSLKESWHRTPNCAMRAYLLSSYWCALRKPPTSFIEIEWNGNYISFHSWQARRMHPHCHW